MNKENVFNGGLTPEEYKEYKEELNKRFLKSVSSD